MVTTVRLLPSEHTFVIEGKDTILEAALRAGLALNYGCSNGNCGLCKARVVSGESQRSCHHDYVLTEAERNQGYMLMCSHTPVTDLVIEAAEAGSAADIPQQQIAARVKRTEALSEAVSLLQLQTPRTNRLRFLAGQSVMLDLNDSLSREYPLASCPCDDRNLQFHIHHEAGDPFTERVAGLRPQAVVNLAGPYGEFVLDETSLRPLLFLAGDTGFAPIKSLIEHAMSRDVADSLHLYWATSAPGGHYLQNLCRSWADALDHFRYTPVVMDALIDQVIVDNPDLSDYDVYVAGPAPLVAATDSLLDRGLPTPQLHSTISGLI